MKKLNVLIIGCILSLVVASYSCKHEGEDYKMGLVLDSGSPSVDGCGWVIKIDSTIYFPNNLAEQFHRDRLEIKLVYKDLNREYECGYPYPPRLYPMIEILKIKEK